MAKHYSKDEQNRILRQLIEVLIFTGYDITDLLFKPRSYFDWEKVEKRNIELRKEHGYD